MSKLQLPLYFDTFGTIVTGAISGLLFPTIVTSVLSSIICFSFSGASIYLSFFNALIGIITVLLSKRGYFKDLKKIILFVLISTLISTFSVSFILYGLYRNLASGLVIENAEVLSSALSIPYLLSICLVNFLLFLFEKGFIVTITIILLRVIPERFIKSFEDIEWNQKFVSESENRYIEERNVLKHPLHARIIKVVVIASLLIVILTSLISLQLYFNNIRESKTETALNCVNFTVDYIDISKLDDFTKFGSDTPGYNETLKKLQNIQDSFRDITYLYVLRIEKNGARFIFDADHNEAYDPGQLVPFDPEMLPHLQDFYEGKEIAPLETRTLFGWLLTVYKPVYNEEGRTVCYIGADVSINYISEYMGSFIIKVLLILSGFFILIIAYTVRTIGKTVSIPISRIANCVDLFAYSIDDEDIIDQQVRLIRSLDIQSGDEIQKLYDALCRMTVSQTEQIRDIRRLSKSTEKMQDGLIVTMADMVENRDSDTGAHILKTAAYVKVIVEGLKKKGYYAQKITPKFMSDIVRSAPLHDVGKINIPDSVLNKPGKLTDEEFAIMKTHTTHGKAILEKAISSVHGESYLKEARNMAAYHHERWDGKGYPEGLHGEVIPLAARIMSVADVFDALCSPRVYKPAFPLEKSLEILQNGSGTQFDPKCIEVFMESLPEIKMILKKYSE